MAETAEPVHKHVYDPLTDEGRTGRKSNRWIIALAIAGILNGAVFVSVWTYKFTSKYKEFTDEATKVSLYKNAPCRSASPAGPA